MILQKFYIYKWNGQMRTNDLYGIAKTGSLCCVAARPHGSNAADREWSVGPQEPYWRTNTSFSPPPLRLDFQLQPEGFSFGSHEGSQFYGSSTSPNSRESRNYLPDHHYSLFDSVAQYFSSPDEISPQEISVDDYGNSSTRVLGPLSFSPTFAATSVVHDSLGSTSSHSDSSDYEPISKSHTSHRCSFISKPIHPCNSSDSFKCGLCGHFLSQRSPWSSRRIVKTGDMPVTGVLSCLHVFHAECLEQTTPKPHKNDPPCPICAKSKQENVTEQRVCLKGNLGKFCEVGPSKQWACTQAGDCVEGALNAPQRNAMLLLNRNRIKKNLSLKGNLGKEFSSKLRKSGLYSSQVFDQEGASSSVKR